MLSLDLDRHRRVKFLVREMLRGDIRRLNLEESFAVTVASLGDVRRLLRWVDSRRTPDNEDIVQEISEDIAVAVSRLLDKPRLLRVNGLSTNEEDLVRELRGIEIK